MAFNAVSNSLKRGSISCQEVRDVIDILNKEFHEELTNLGVDFHMSHAMASLENTNAKVNDVVSSFVAQCGE
jgi:GTP1/Obg family GTP-binding protein